MNAELPPEIVRLLGSMFAGHTGFSIEEMGAFFRAKGVELVTRPEDPKPRRAALERALNALPPRERVAALQSLLGYQGRMRHGHPPETDKARLRAGLQDSWIP